MASPDPLPHPEKIHPSAFVAPGAVVMGLPGKVIRPVNEADQERIRRTAEHYVEAGRVYKAAYARERKE